MFTALNIVQAAIIIAILVLAFLSYEWLDNQLTDDEEKEQQKP